MEKKYPAPKKSSATKYMFGAMKASQAQYKNGGRRLTRSEPSKPLSVDEMLKQMRGNNERKANRRS